METKISKTEGQALKKLSIKKRRMELHAQKRGEVGEVSKGA